MELVFGSDGYYGQQTGVRAKCIICVAGVVRRQQLEEREILVILQWLQVGMCVTDL